MPAITKSEKAQRRRQGKQRRREHERRKRLERDYECECCGKREASDGVQIALTRNWGLACVECIDNGSMSEMVGEDITAYKIEDVPPGYRPRY